jgi:hypothetical protein
MELNPNPEIHKKLKDMAKKEGVSLNALLVPFLNDIALGRIERGSYWVTPSQGQKAG